MPRTCPCLVHTVRRTALGPQGASTSSPLGAATGGVVDAEPGLARASPMPIRSAASTWSSPVRAGPVWSNLAFHNPGFLTFTPTVSSRIVMMLQLSSFPFPIVCAALNISLATPVRTSGTPNSLAVWVTMSRSFT